MHSQRKFLFNFSYRNSLEINKFRSFLCRSNCDSSAANILRTYYTRPYFLPDVAESSKTDWIFMGSTGYGAHRHVSSRGLAIICKYISFVTEIVKQVSEHVAYKLLLL